MSTLLFDPLVNLKLAKRKMPREVQYKYICKISDFWIHLYFMDFFDKHDISFLMNGWGDFPVVNCESLYPNESYFGCVC